MQLADISRPGRIHKDLHGFRTNFFNLSFITSGQCAEKIFCQQRYILLALIQRREFKAHNIEAVEEILSEHFFCNSLFQIPVCRRNNTYINRHRDRAPHGSDLLFLQYPEQLNLEMQRHVTNLIKKQRALVGRLKKAEITFCGTCKSRLGMSEQLGLKQCFRDGSTVNRYKRAIPATAGPMNSNGQEFLARTAFSTYQNTRISISNQPGPGKQILHYSAF